MKLRYDAYCGLNCGACPVGIANEQNDEDTLLRYSREWGVSREDLSCSGCKTDVTAGFCTSCTMRKCAGDRGIEFCFQCGEYPCETITAFRNDQAAHHSAVLKNLDDINRLGIEGWLAFQKERWACPVCKERYGWYADKCSCCEAELYDSVKEEKDIDNAQGNED